MKFLEKWMELVNIILSDVTHPQKNILVLHSLISGYPFLIFLYISGSAFLGQRAQEICPFHIKRYILVILLWVIFK